MLNVSRPRLHRFANVQEVQDFIEAEANKDATFEGVVVKDCNNLRMKIKNSTYLSLHRMRGNGDNMFHPKNLVSFVLQQKDRDELLVYFPEVKPFLDKMVANYNKIMKELDNYWFCYHDEKSQRKFAEGVKNCNLSSILFLARRNGDTLQNTIQNDTKAKEILSKFLVSTFS
jgi:hypothetical protein